MATDLKEYLAGKECKAFESRPNYFEDGDYVTYFASDVFAYEDRIDELVTVYRSVETSELIGCKIKGVQRIVETLGGFAIFVKGDSFRLGMLFMGAALLNHKRRDEYQEISKEYGQVPLDPSELPSSLAA